MFCSVPPDVGPTAVHVAPASVLVKKPLKFPAAVLEIRYARFGSLSLKSTPILPTRLAGRLQRRVRLALRERRVVDVRPRVAAVGRAVDVGVRAVDARLLVADLVPRRREHDVGVGLVDRDVDRAGGGALRDDHAGPRGPAVLGHEQAARRHRVVQRAHDGDEDAVVVARVDDDPADRVAVLEAHVGPRRAAVGRLVDALAVVRRAAAVVDLAGAGPDDALGVDRDRADRLRQVVVPRAGERRAAVGRLPDALRCRWRCRRRPAWSGSAAMSRMRPPMLLGPSSAHT